MQFNLKKLRTNEGVEQTAHYTLKVQQSLFDSLASGETEVTINGSAVCKNQLIVITYQVDFMFHTLCARCLDPVERKMSYSFLHELDREEIEGFEEGIIVDNDFLDLDKLAVSDIQLNFPLKILCTENCKGLCPVCGTNLNHGSCNCSSQSIDPRLEALKELLQ